MKNTILIIIIAVAVLVIFGSIYYYGIMGKRETKTQYRQTNNPASGNTDSSTVVAKVMSYGVFSCPHISGFTFSHPLFKEWDPKQETFGGESISDCLSAKRFCFLLPLASMFEPRCNAARRVRSPGKNVLRIIRRVNHKRFLASTATTPASADGWCSNS